MDRAGTRVGLTSRRWCVFGRLCPLAGKVGLKVFRITTPTFSNLLIGPGGGPLNLVPADPGGCPACRGTSRRRAQCEGQAVTRIAASSVGDGDGRSSEVALDRDGELCNSAPVRLGRLSRRCVLELGESRLRALRRDEVALAFVAFERLLERLSGFLRAIGK
jgi:hypothetical protein